MTSRTVCAVFVLLLCSSVASAFEPTDKYTDQQIEGWTVKVHHSLLEERKDLGDAALKLLGVKLYDITRALPAPALAKLRTIPIWLEYNDPKFPCACYHPDKGWLKANDVNPDKAEAVEIANAETFLKWSHAQPSMVLHELAHGYHHRIGYDNAEIKAAFKQALEGKKYESVLYQDGSTKRHYGLNNDQEFFAEASEAYFGTNDFYPFVRAELKAFDPVTYAAVRKAWGVE
jgi:hypothetical protein